MCLYVCAFSFLFLKTNFVLCFGLVFSNREKKRQVQSWMGGEIGRVKEEMREGKLIGLYLL